MGHLLEGSQAVSGASVDPVWVDEEFVERALEENTVQNRGMFPIWHPLSGENAAVSSVSGARARAAGLHNRPVRETIRDLLSWWRTLPEERTATMRAGMPAELEAKLIALWKKENA
jgi:2'-hydroxyisoflavone reductase